VIILPVEPGSFEWLQARLGIPTASCFSKIVSPKQLKPSAQATGYMHQLCAEWLIGAPLDELDTPAMARGRELEPQAVRYYEMQRDCETTVAGFCLNDDRTIGCSPDRLVGQDGGLEIKCPMGKQQVSNILNGVDGEHRCQVQGCLWVTGRSWWDVLSFHPQLACSLVRVERDPAFMAALDDALPAFVEGLAEMRGKLEALGCVPKEATDGDRTDG
jgi:hypothetical protein